MIALDTNILVYAHRRDLAEHDPAREVLEELLRGTRPGAFCWPVLAEFLAVVTNPRLFRDPTPPELAIRQLDDWLASPTATLLRERVRATWRRSAH